MVDISLLWEVLSMFGDIQYWLGLTMGILIVYLAVGKNSKKKVAWIIFALLPAVILTSQVTYFLKLWFQTPRPCEGQIDCPNSYSFPSAHAAVMFAFATVAVLNVKDVKYKIASVGLAFLVSISRVALNVHTPLDIFIGSIVGIACGLLVQEAYKTIDHLRISQQA